MKILLFKGLLKLMGNFMEFFRKNVSKMEAVHEIFDIPRYLNSMKDENKKFMKEFVNTQNFTGFLEVAYKTHTCNNEVSYFLKGAKILLFYGESDLDLYCSQILSNAIESYNHVSHSLNFSL
jgi:3-hydroxy-3-methylglutaryl CoA synthase